jgi:hypothetical protein
MSDTTHQLRAVCGHDSRSISGCLHCEAADLIERLRADLRFYENAIWKESQGWKK